MIHLYCGDGKGKTTCAFGLALRAAGRGLAPVVVQFLKSADSGERLALESVPGVTLLDAPAEMKFTFDMTPQEREETAALCADLLARTDALLAGGEHRMVVLDECCAAVGGGFLPLEEVLALLDRYPAVEFVLTGRDPAGELLARADYVTEMKKLRHPYDRGTAARIGVEW